METVRCICRNCESEILECINIWTKIGARYVSPVIQPDEETLGIQDYGDVRLGNKGSIVEECQIQNIACASCTKEIGLRCIATPVNHVLEENQVLLNATYLALLDDDGDEAEFVFKRTLDVKEPSKVNSSSGGSNPSAYEVVDVFKLQSDLQMQREELSRIDTNGFKLVYALDKRVTGTEREVKKLQDTLGDVRRDMSGAEDDIKSVKTEVGEVKRLVQSQPSVAGLEERLNSLTGTLGEVQEEVADLVSQYDNRLADLTRELSQSRKDLESLRSDIKESVTSRQHTEDMSAVLAELAQLRREMTEIRSKPRDQTSTPFPSRELEILTSNIAKIGSRANQVEPLQMEFEILKGRVERMEADRQILNSEPGQPAIRSNVMGDSHPQLKRSISAIEGPAVQNPVVQNPVLSKRPMLSAPYLNTPSQSHDTSREREDTVTNMSASKVRLTKDGKVDKRSLRYRKSSSGTK